MKENGKEVFVFPDAEDVAVIDASAVVGKIANIVFDRRGSSWTLPFALDKFPKNVCSLGPNYMNKTSD